MLGFFRKRLVREHARLLHQSMLAIGYLSGYFKDHDFSGIEAELRDIVHSRWYQTPLSVEQAGRVLEINREFRRLYDGTPDRHLKSFDDEFTPPLGWNNFFNEVGI